MISPYINHFLCADTVISSYANPQNLNRYSYALGNPIKYIDPTGHRACDDVDAAGNCITAPGSPAGGCGNGECGDRRNPKDLKTSDKGVDFIIYWEAGGLPPAMYPYKDMGGTCTIGYGHTFYNPDSPDGRGCSKAVLQYYKDNPLSPTGAMDFLNADIGRAEKLIRNKVKGDLTQAQFDALVSYIYNSGDQPNQPFMKKGIPELINNGNYQGAAEAIASGPITSGGSKSDALVERRWDEAYLFLRAIYLVP